MNIFNTYKRTRFFLWINITGLAIGLAASIMLILFVVNEWSYDRHFASHERIVRLLTVYEHSGATNYAPINLRKAYTEAPQNVPGIEAALQVYISGKAEITVEQQRYQELESLTADPEFFRVFRTKFVEGTPDACLVDPHSAVITRHWANVIFGSPEAAMNRTVSFKGAEHTVTAVVEAFPYNSHLNFDFLAPIKSLDWLDKAGGLEFRTYYLIREGASVGDTRKAIEEANTAALQPWAEQVGATASGETEMLDDVYLKTKATYGAQGDMRFIWILTGLALFILVLAVTNFINLFMTHGQMRMNEIGIRKSNGAQMADIVRQFFSEVALIVLIAYILGFVLAVACVPHFAVLIGKNIDLVQLLNPLFIISAAVLFVLTVFLSAFYPALYLSRFSPLEIFGKRIRFSKRRLTASVVVFQSAIAIILLSVILVLYRQTVYLQELPLGYNPDNVMVFPGNNTINSSYGAIRQDLLNYPEVKDVRGSHHIFGSGSGSGQVIARWEDRDNRMLINEYRMMPGLPEMMELKTAEGRFWREDDPDSILTLVINEAAVKMLGDESPLEKTYFYHGIQARVIGVVKDFCYDNPAAGIAPMLFSRIYNPATFNIRFNEGVSRIRARELTEEAIRRIDPAFVLSPMWSADIYSAKFKAIKTVTLIVLLGSLIAIFVAMLGLLAIHLFSAMRRTKEIGIRRIHGAERSSVFLLLSLDVLKWIGYAAVFAIPAAVYFISRILDSYASHVSPDWTIFVLPAFAQCVIALLATSGVSLSVLKRNPIESLKSE